MHLSHVLFNCVSPIKSKFVALSGRNENPSPSMRGVRVQFWGVHGGFPADQTVVPNVPRRFVRPRRGFQLTDSANRFGYHDGPELVKEAARRYPESLFYFADEMQDHPAPSEIANYPPPLCNRGFFTAAEYVSAYADFVGLIRSGSQRARVSPGGMLTSDGRFRWASAFYDCIAADNIPIDEWRFHLYFIPRSTQGMVDEELSFQLWRKDLDLALTFAREHGDLPIVVGIGNPSYLWWDSTAMLRRAMRAIKAEPRIIESFYWRFWTTPEEAEPHGLTRPDLAGAEYVFTEDGDVYLQEM